jgi:hypothetical protein
LEIECYGGWAWRREGSGTDEKKRVSERGNSMKKLYYNGNREWFGE